MDELVLTPERGGPSGQPLPCGEGEADLIILAVSCLVLAGTDGLSPSETLGPGGCSQTGSGVL